MSVLENVKTPTGLQSCIWNASMYQYTIQDVHSYQNYNTTYNCYYNIQNSVTSSEMGPNYILKRTTTGIKKLNINPVSVKTSSNIGHISINSQLVINHIIEDTIYYIDPQTR